MKTLLIANRGEIAVRLAATARDQGYAVITIYPEDDAACAHVAAGDTAIQIPGVGAAAYLDIEAVLQAAKSGGATAIHPGYGFLSEQSPFAAACEAAGLTFIGPTPDQLATFGNKAGAKAVASACGVPLSLIHI